MYQVQGDWMSGESREAPWAQLGGADSDATGCKKNCNTCSIKAAIPTHKRASSAGRRPVHCQDVPAPHHVHDGHTPAGELRDA